MKKISLIIVHSFLVIGTIIGQASSQYKFTRNYFSVSDVRQKAACLWKDKKISAALVEFIENDRVNSFGLNFLKLNGDVTSCTKYRTGNEDLISVCQVREQDNYIYIGGTIEYGQNQHTPFIMKINPFNQTVIKASEIESNYSDITLVDFEVDNGENITFVATNNISSFQKSMVVGRFALSSNTFAFRVEYSLDPDETIPVEMALLKGNSLIGITGYTKSSGGFVVGLELSGRPRFEIIIPPIFKGQTRGYGICDDLYDGKTFLVCGSEVNKDIDYAIDLNAVLVARLDINGNIMNNSVYIDYTTNNLVYNYMATEIAQGSKGNFIVSGSVIPPSGSNNLGGLFVLNVDGNGGNVVGRAYETPIDIGNETLVVNSEQNGGDSAPYINSFDALVGCSALPWTGTVHLSTLQNGAGISLSGCNNYPINIQAVTSTKKIEISDTGFSIDMSLSPIEFINSSFDFGNFDECDIVAKQSSHNPKSLTSLAPNPASESTIINASKGDIQGITLFDIAGRLLQQFDFNEGQYDVELNTYYLENGTYFIQVIKNSGETERHKLIIQK